MRDICPVIAVFGNHDLIGGSEGLAAILRKRDITILRDDTYQLIGGPLLVGTRDFNYESGARTALQRITGSTKVILMTHNPDIVLALNDAEKKKIAFGLAGHTHGGQIRIPGIGPYNMQQVMLLVGGRKNSAIAPTRRIPETSVHDDHLRKGVARLFAVHCFPALEERLRLLFELTSNGVVRIGAVLAKCLKCLLLG